MPAARHNGAVASSSAAPGGPPPGTCDIWWVEPARARPELLDLLDDDERDRHARFRLPADRDRYLAAHALARLVCGQAAGVPPERVEFTLHCPVCDRTDPHGKPRPAGTASGLEISWSHSGDRVGVALARDVPVGLDVERVSAGRDIDGLADHVLAAAERADLDALPPERRTAGFFGYWTRKEALLKATGHGLAGGPTSVEVGPPDAPAAVRAWHGPAAQDAVWLTDLDAGPGYRAALAALCAGPLTVVVHDGTALLAAGATPSAPPQPSPPG